MYPPKRTKYRKHQKGRSKGVQSNLFKIVSTNYQIISASNTRLRASTIEAVRRIITRKLKRLGQVSVKVHPSKSVTKKPLEVRMGKGKGSVAYWICPIKKGQLLYEIDGVEFSKIYAAWLDASVKLPIKTIFCSPRSF